MQQEIQPPGLEIGQVVHGHKVHEAVMLSKKAPHVRTTREGRPITGDIGRLMPIAQAEYLQDLQAWIGHFAAKNIPCCVVKERRRFVLYKERRCEPGAQRQDIRR